jgi:hypothetical protein
MEIVRIHAEMGLATVLRASLEEILQYHLEMDETQKAEVTNYDEMCCLWEGIDLIEGAGASINLDHAFVRGLRATGFISDQEVQNASRLKYRQPPTHVSYARGWADRKMWLEDEHGARYEPPPVSLESVIKQNSAGG